MQEAPTKEYPVKRLSHRAKIARPVRVRPFDPRDDHFEDLPVTVNASKEGIYFTSRRKSHYKGMRVFVTFPFSSPHDPMNCEYVAEVMRVEDLPNGKSGVAVHLKMSINYSGSAASGSATRRLIQALTWGASSFILVLRNERHPNSSGAPPSSRPHAAPPEVCITIR